MKMMMTESLAIITSEKVIRPGQRCRTGFSPSITLPIAFWPAPDERQRDGPYVGRVENMETAFITPSAIAGIDGCPTGNEISASELYVCNTFDILHTDCEA